MGPSFDEFLARLRAGHDPAPPPSYGPYHSYRGLWEQVAEVVRGVPTTFEMYGRSTGGEPLWAVRIGVLEQPRRRVLYLANLHAQEFIGVEAALATLSRAATRIRRGDPKLHGVEITCVPTANPDGYRRVLVDLAAGRGRFRRKNLRGVDLNRNFAEGFERGATLARLVPFVFDPGEEPLSEPETAALDGLFARRFDRAISFHSFGDWIFWPWAARDVPSPDDERFAALAAEMQRRMETPYRCSQLGRWAWMFRAGGAEIDHLYGRYRTLAFLFEVSSGGRRIDRPSTWLDAFCWYNPSDIEGTVSDVASAALALADTV